MPVLGPWGWRERLPMLCSLLVLLPSWSSAWWCQPTPTIVRTPSHPFAWLPKQTVPSIGRATSLLMRQIGASASAQPLPRATPPTTISTSTTTPPTQQQPSVRQEGGSIWDSFQEVFIEEGNQTQRLLMQAVPYFFFRDELGIPEEKMYRIAISYGNVLGMNLAMVKQKLAYLQAELGLTRPQTTRLIEAYPALLLRNLEVVVPATLRFLREDLALEQDEHGVANPRQLRRVVLSCPSLLIAGIPRMQETIQYLESELGMTKRQVRKLAISAPFALTTGLAGIKRKVEFFKGDIGIKDTEVRSLVIAMPTLLVLSMDTILDKIEYLTGEVHLPMTVLRKVLLKSPTLLLQSLERSIIPKVDFFRSELRMTREEIVKTIELVPRIFNYDFNRRTLPFFISIQNPPFRLTKVQVRKIILRSPALINLDMSSDRFLSLVQALREVACHTDKDLSYLVKLFPQVLSFTPERIRSHVDFFQTTLGMSDADISILIKRHPQLLGYKLESIATKLELIAEILEVDEEKLREMVLNCPTILSFSAEKRIRPRLEQAKLLNFSVEKAVVMLMYTNERFGSVIQVKVDQPPPSPSPSEEEGS